VNRRKLITLLGGAAATWPLATWAQLGSARHIGVLMNGAATEVAPQSYVATFVQTLRQLGWIEGQNVRVDVRWSAGDAALARIYAAQLIDLTPDVLLASSTTNLTAIQQGTSTVPVVFVQVSDPVEQGFVANLTRPGGNLTGFSIYEFVVGGKWLDLLKEIAPNLTRIGVMFNPDTSPQSKFFMRSIEAAAPSHGVQAAVVPVRSTADIEPAFERYADAPNGGLILTTDTFTGMREQMIVDLAHRYRLPAISSNSRFPKDGGLMYYGANVNLTDQFQQAARGSHSQGHKARRSAHPAGGQIHACHKSKNSQSARPHSTATAIRLSRRADRMKRREFITLLSGAAALPLAARAQQPMPVIGLLSGRSPVTDAPLIAVMQHGLNDTGFVEGQNFAIDYRWADGHYDRLPALAADLVQRRVACIITIGGDISVMAAKPATATVPIVFLLGSDPVRSGFVTSLNHPGGNITGVSAFQIELETKNLELLRELRPNAATVAVLLNPSFSWLRRQSE
jgi:putative ABC transport system substrate-binding protein